MSNEEQTYHVPVLLNESIDGMNLQPGGIYVDVTFGGGGHSKEILRQGDESIRLFSFDQDEDAEKNIVNDKRFTFVRSNFRYLHNFLRYHGVEQVDAILADLGVSSHHFDDSERGFSFRFDGKLDMRMNKRASMTAAEVVNTYDEERLADIFYLYGELKNSRKLASAIAKARANKQIVTIGDFLDIVKPMFGREREKKELAKVFQALRIEVNQEMEALKEMLYAATEALKPGGRLVVITYHSLERDLQNVKKETPTSEPQVLKERIVETAAGTDKQQKAKRFILAAKLFSAPYAEGLTVAELPLKDETHIIIANYIADREAKGERIRPSELFELLDENCAEFNAILDLNYGDKLIGDVAERFFKDSLKTLQKEAIEEEIAKLNQAYASATEENERKEIAKQLSVCVQKRNALKKA